MKNKCSGDFAVKIEDLTVAYDSRPVLWDIDLTIPKGKLAAIVGPNGAGKSTLLKAILELVKPVTGSVEICLGEMSATKKTSSLIGYVPQNKSIDWDFPTTVLDVVLMGRYGQLGWIKRPSKKDVELAKTALAKVNMLEYANRQINKLSGGQQQRVFLARAIVQDAEIYFMDEPFKGVDIKTEQMIIDLLKEIRDAGKTVVVVHHDLQKIADYFDWLILVNLNIKASGPIEEVFTEENIIKTYNSALPKFAPKSGENL